VPGGADAENLAERWALRELSRCTIGTFAGLIYRSDLLDPEAGAHKRPSIHRIAISDLAYHPDQVLPPMLFWRYAVSIAIRLLQNFLRWVCISSSAAFGSAPITAATILLCSPGRCSAS